VVIDFARWDLDALERNWREARPFSHVVIDDVLAPDELTALVGDIAKEPHWRNFGELYDFMASAENVMQPRLRAFQAALAALIPSLRTFTGRDANRVELRSYVYLAGSYLLPHSDWRSAVGRQVAFAYYAHTAGCTGGELELFEATLEDGYPVTTTPVCTIEPRGNRLVLFEVTPASLHQVREVLAGWRVSLSGWFLD
jgi:Rps23 Pro-64 3,4-dihydroxylase Tpa1-like proline 4-hydroxylase